jgi:WS/DGAT/MGAT family acyltransferase
MREVLVEKPATRTSLNRYVGPDRCIALLRVPAADVRRIGRAGRATPNDVLLALTAGGIRELLASRGEPVEHTTIRVYVPVSLRRGRAKRSPTANGNAVAQMAVPIVLGGADPIARLRRIAAETARRRRRPRTSLGRWFASDVVTALLLRVIARQRVNVTIANLPGSKSEQRLLGAPLRAVFPVVPLIGNVPLGVGAVSYAGFLDIGITADRAAFPDLDVLVEAMHSELRALCAAAVRESPADQVAAAVVTPPGGEPGEPWGAAEVRGS